MTLPGFEAKRVKLVAIGLEEVGPFIEATPQNVASRTYPFTRSVSRRFRCLHCSECRC